MLWSIGAIDVNAPSLERMGLLLAGLALAALALRATLGVRADRRPGPLVARAAGGHGPLVALADRSLGPLVALYALAIGASERLERELLVDGSDVVRATKESLEVLLAGSNPYAHALQSTIPPGSPLVYGPGELFFYLPAHVLTGDIGRVETWAGILTVALLGLAGLRVGFERAALPAMLYATWGIAAFRTTDGGNDVAAAVPVVAGLVALAFVDFPGRPGRVAFALSAALLGWALAFKQFAVLVVPLVLRHLAVTGAPWRRYALATAGVTAAFDLPFLAWDPGAFLSQHVVRALTNHRETWGANLMHTLLRLDPGTDRLEGAFFAAEVALTLGALALLVRWRIPTLGAAALAAAGLVALPLLLARWTTQSYYVYAATVALAGLALIELRAAPRESATRPASLP